MKSTIMESLKLISKVAATEDAQQKARDQEEGLMENVVKCICVHTCLINHQTQLVDLLIDEKVPVSFKLHSSIDPSLNGSEIAQIQ
jgi:hypothetical protein